VHDVLLYAKLRHL